MSDYVDFDMLKKRAFVNFISNISFIEELCKWLGKNQTIGNPFEWCCKAEFNATMNYNEPNRHKFYPEQNVS